MKKLSNAAVLAAAVGLAGAGALLTSYAQQETNPKMVAENHGGPSFTRKIALPATEALVREATPAARDLPTAASLDCRSQSMVQLRTLRPHRRKR
jgi:hypothetical protein